MRGHRRPTRDRRSPHRRQGSRVAGCASRHRGRPMNSGSACESGHCNIKQARKNRNGPARVSAPLRWISTFNAFVQWNGVQCHTHMAPSTDTTTSAAAATSAALPSATTGANAERKQNRCRRRMTDAPMSQGFRSPNRARRRDPNPGSKSCTHPVGTCCGSHTTRSSLLGDGFAARGTHSLVSERSLVR